MTDYKALLLAIKDKNHIALENPNISLRSHLKAVNILIKKWVEEK